MKKCNTELMKELNALNDEKSKLLQFENENCVVSYLKDETPVEIDYNYDNIRKQIDEIEKKERAIKQLLSYSNATTKVDGYDLTISEALVYLAQLNNRKHQMEYLSQKLPISRTVVYDKVQYNKALFDVEKAKKELKDLIYEISKLQMAIDRTNLTNIIDC